MGTMFFYLKFMDESKKCKSLVRYNFAGDYYYIYRPGFYFDLFPALFPYKTQLKKPEYIEYGFKEKIHV
jgi:hypothetical protein